MDDCDNNGIDKFFTNSQVALANILACKKLMAAVLKSTYIRNSTSTIHSPTTNDRDRIRIEAEAIV